MSDLSDQQRERTFFERVQDGLAAEKAHEAEFQEYLRAQGRNLSRGVAGKEPEPAQRPAQSLLARGVAASGLSQTTYVRAKKVVATAQADPERYGDLLKYMEDTSPFSAYEELRRRAKKNALDSVGMRTDGVVKRHPMFRKTKHARPNVEIERAIHAMDGVCLSLEMIDVGALDPQRRKAWSEALRNIAFSVSVFAGKVVSK